MIKLRSEAWQAIVLLAAINSSSEQSLVVPYKLLGAAALSVHKAIILSISVSRDTYNPFSALKTLIKIYSIGL